MNKTQLSFQLLWWKVELLYQSCVVSIQSSPGKWQPQSEGIDGCLGKLIQIKQKSCALNLYAWIKRTQWIKYYGKKNSTNKI